MKHSPMWRVAGLTWLVAALALALPAHADGGGGDGASGVISPGFGTLDAIVGWLWLLVF